MVIRGESLTRVYLDEISTLIIESTAVSLTAALLSALVDKKIKVIFCDEKRNPSSELIPYSGCHDSTDKIRTQLAWSASIKKSVWAEIIRDKIRKQAEYLDELKLSEASMLYGYCDDVQLGDSTNREGHAAKVYFHSAFGSGFSRDDDSNVINAALNYGYSLILSMINREISACGYLLQLGIFHDNMFNPYNLSCDLMEPFRILVDRFVREMDPRVFGTDEKHSLITIFDQSVRIDNTTQSLPNAVKIYVRSVFTALREENISLLKFPCYEL